MAKCFCRQIEQVEEGERMSLLEEAFETLTIINKLDVPDGYGGKERVWIDGAEIQGALDFQNGNLQRVALALGSNITYRLIVRKDTDLDFHTVFKNSEGRTFRVLSNSDDNKTPKSAYLNMRLYDVEEYALTN